MQISYSNDWPAPTNYPEDYGDIMNLDLYSTNSFTVSNIEFQYRPLVPIDTGYTTEVIEEPKILTSTDITLTNALINKNDVGLAASFVNTHTIPAGGKISIIDSSESFTFQLIFDR
jgi:hypothetical protein